MNRKVAPHTTIPELTSLPSPQIVDFANGNQLMIINAGSQDVSKIDIIADAGTRYQDKLLTARATTNLLSEGSKKYTSQQIAEKLDFLGSFSEAYTNHDYSTLTLLANNRFLDKSLDIVAEMFYNPSFPEHELEIYCKKKKQAYTIDLQKVSTLARNAFYQNIFKGNHPFGKCADPSDFDLITRADLETFHKKNHLGKNLFIVLSGKISDTEIKLVEKYFGSPIPDHNPIRINTLPDIEQCKPYRIGTPKENSVQNAIRIGKLTISGQHPDFPALMVLNTVLGGYFGSRLMSNIREDKGYTYSISSNFIGFRDYRIMLISTEVGSQYTNDTISEIYKEINRLKTEEIDNQELNLVKNVIMGNILRTFDGPFAISDSFASIYKYNNSDFNYFKRAIETIKTITSKQLIEVANKYLTDFGMVESVAGNMDYYQI